MTPTDIALIVFEVACVFALIIAYIDIDKLRKKLEELQETIEDIEDKYRRIATEVGRIEMDLAGVLRDLRDIKDWIEARSDEA